MESPTLSVRAVGSLYAAHTRLRRRGSALGCRQTAQNDSPTALAALAEGAERANCLVRHGVDSVGCLFPSEMSISSKLAIWTRGARDGLGLLQHAIATSLHGGEMENLLVYHLLPCPLSPSPTPSLLHPFTPSDGPGGEGGEGRGGQSPCFLRSMNVRARTTLP